MKNVLLFACFTGFFGDVILQTTTLGTQGGLDSYFQQHGRVESLFIAAGMMTLFYALMLVARIPLTFFTVSVVGVFIDLCFRQFRVFPSLDSYYETLNYFWSAFWIIIPMCIPLALQKIVV